MPTQVRMTHPKHSGSKGQTGRSLLIPTSLLICQFHPSPSKNRQILFENYYTPTKTPDVFRSTRADENFLVDATMIIIKTIRLAFLQLKIQHTRICREETTQVAYMIVRGLVEFHERFYRTSQARSKKQSRDRKNSSSTTCCFSPLSFLIGREPEKTLSWREKIIRF